MGRVIRLREVRSALSSPIPSPPGISIRTSRLELVLQGTCDFEVGGERRQLNVGDTYVIPANVPHEAVAGPAGCVLIDVFAPTRDDWRRHEPQPLKTPRWPSSK
jgi:hypothetical protein